LGTVSLEAEDSNKSGAPGVMGVCCWDGIALAWSPDPSAPRIPPDTTTKIMKSLWTTLGLSLLLAAPLAAQDQDNEAKYKAKLAESFVSNIDWVQNLEEAQQQAKDKRMLIYGHFSRSYAP
jgi:hypothetical protein